MIGLSLAAGFLTPGLALAGAALVAVPIVIHLLNRRRFKMVHWAAMEFVLRAVRQNRRRMRFESWLLLALRCLVIGLAGAALARPMGCANSALAAAAPGEGGLHILVLDDSASARQTTSGEGSNFDVQKRIAASLIEAFGQGGGRVAVLAASRSADDPVATPTFNLAAARAAVEAAQPTYQITDLAAALDRARRIAEEAGAAEAVRVHVFTDAAATAVADPRLSDVAAGLADAAELRVYRPIAPAPANAAVLDLAPTDPLVRRGFRVDLQATAARFGGAGSAGAAWQVDEQTRDSSTVALGNEPAQLVADPSVLDAAADGRAHLVRLSLAGEDAIPADDARQIVIEQVRELPVLLVAGRAAEAGAAFDPNAILAAALSPGDGGYVEVERISDLELGGRPLDGYRAILLAGVGGLEEATAAQLARYVRGGGVLMNWLGERTAPDADTARLGPLGLLPGAIVSRNAVEADGDLFAFDFDPRQAHRYLAAFANVDATGLDAPAVRQYWRLELPPAGDESGAEVVLRFAGTGDPAVIVHPLGRGRIVTVATAAADPEWTLLQIRPNFAAFVHELLRHAVGEAGGTGGAGLTLDAGVAFRLPTSLRVPAGVVPRLIVDGDARPLTREVDADGTIAWAGIAPREPGSYALAVDADRLPVAVNFPASESDLRRAEDATLREAFGGEAELIDLSDEAVEQIVASDADRPDWGWPLLVAVLLLAGGEAAYAALLGRRRRVAVGG